MSALNLTTVFESESAIVTGLESVTDLGSASDSNSASAYSSVSVMKSESAFGL